MSQGDSEFDSDIDDIIATFINAVSGDDDKPVPLQDAVEAQCVFLGSGLQEGMTHGRVMEASSEEQGSVVESG